VIFPLFNLLLNAARKKGHFLASRYQRQQKKDTFLPPAVSAT
jgi:hypothetical protein